MTYNEELPGFVRFLKYRLEKELPGISAHLQMAPMKAGVPYRPFSADEEPTQSAVMILLKKISGAEDYEILLTLRSAMLSSHSGQISFPGGRAESGETPNDTALREAAEEIGLDALDAIIIGSMSQLFVPPSKMIIMPIIAFQLRDFDIKPNPDEVEEILTVKLSYLCDISNVKTEKWRFNDDEINVPLWRIHPHTPLWGATAMILSELIELFEEYRKFC